MPQNKSQIMEFLKLIMGLGMILSFVFYAGKLDEKVSTHTNRLDKTDSRLEKIETKVESLNEKFIEKRK